MLRTRGHVFVRAISAICVMALVLAACGGSDSSSNRNGRLNSTLCFDTQIDKEQAIDDAQRALDEAKTPSLEEASPSNNGGRATLAFIGPQLWWMQTASGGSTTTTTQPATTTSTSTSTSSTSTTVASSTSSTSPTSTTVVSSTDSTDASTDVSTDSTDVSTDSTDVSTDTSIPLLGDIPLQQLEEELAAVKDAPLCSELDNEEASDTTLVDAESEELIAGPGQEICSASLSNGSFSFLCERLLNVIYFSSVGGPEEMEPVNSSNSLSVWSYASDVTTAKVVASTGSGIVFDETISNPATADESWEFVVPVQETESESGDSWFLGSINPRVGDNELSFTIPKDYSHYDLVLDLTFECESQEIEAVVRHDAFEFEFVYPDWDPGLPEGICLLHLSISGSEYLFPGGRYDIVIAAATDAEIEWAGKVELEGDVVSDVVSLDTWLFQEGPFYSGFFDPTNWEESVFFTIPNNYSAPYPVLALYTECEDQTVEASLLKDGEVLAAFVEISRFLVSESLCGVWLVYDEAVDVAYGETFEVVIRTETDQRISWSGTVALEGDGVTQDGELIDVNDEQFIWEEILGGEIDAEYYVTLEIPEGGRQVDVRAITTRLRNQEYYVDPYLVIFNDNDAARDWDDNGGEDYGYGDYSSRLNVFLEEGTYTLLATTYELWREGDDGWPTTYDLELRVGSLPVSTDKVAPSVDQPEEQQVQVEVLDVPPSNLEEPKPVFELPVNEVINRDKSSNEPNPIIPAGVTEVVCDSGCLLALREAAGVSEGIVTVQIGGELIEVQPGARNAIIPVRPSAKEILVTVTPSDGGEPVVLSTEVLVISPRTFPTKMAEGAKTVTKSASSNGGIPTNLIVVLVVLALGIAIGLIRRQKVRLPE